MLVIQKLQKLWKGRHMRIATKSVLIGIMLSCVLLTFPTSLTCCAGNEDISLLWPSERKGLIFKKWTGPHIKEVVMPEGFLLSPVDVFDALGPSKFVFSIYADDNFYYVVFGWSKRISLVKDYGFKIDGKTGETHLPLKQKPYKLSIPKRMMDHATKRLSEKNRNALLQKADEIADSFIKAIGKCNYNFLTEDQIAGLRREIRDFASHYLNGRMSNAKFKTLSKSIENYGLRRVRSDDPDMLYSLEIGYFEFRDQVNTFKWLLWKALTRGSLSASDLKRRNAQHKWLKEFIKTVPFSQSDWMYVGVESNEMRQWAEDSLEQRLANPLSLMSEAMTDEQFVNFKEWMKRSSKNSLVMTISDIRSRSIGAHAHKRCDIEDVYRYPFDIDLPFEDEVLSMFGGPDTHLAFASNARFRGKETFLDARGRSILDVIKLLTVSLDSETDSKKLQQHFTRWADQNHKGDVAYLHEDARLIMLRGAGFATLKVKNWLDADRVTDDELRELINKDSRTEISVKGLPPMNGPMRLDTRIFIAVETAEKRLAVIALKNREFGSLVMRCRARGER